MNIINVLTAVAVFAFFVAWTLYIHYKGFMEGYSMGYHKGFRDTMAKHAESLSVKLGSGDKK